MKRAYMTKRFSAETRSAIFQANRILEEYVAQGFDLTLRQLYYQHVARGLIENTERSYKRLGSIVSDARMAGLIDWDYITDRTRNLASVPHWDSPADIIEATVRSFRLDTWADQDSYVEVWIEKDALVGVIGGTCRELDVPYFSCRGYTSQSEMWVAGQRLVKKLLAGKRVVVLHLGDHDPSGIDMTRDIEARLVRFLMYDTVRGKNEGSLSGLSDEEATDIAREAVKDFQVRRIALTMDQVEEYSPPPNPAKVTDSRARDYIAEYGTESWELDALEPSVMAALISEHVEGELDREKFDAAIDREREAQRLLRQASERWDEIVETLTDE